MAEERLPETHPAVQRAAETLWFLEDQIADLRKVATRLHDDLQAACDELSIKLPTRSTKSGGVK